MERSQSGRKFENIQEANSRLKWAVWVGAIALAGLDAESGLVMLLYLDNSYERFRGLGQMNSRDDLWNAVHDGAVKRIRPKTMTVFKIA